jgi:hypothetical protein
LVAIIVFSHLSLLYIYDMLYEMLYDIILHLYSVNNNQSKVAN